MPVEGSGAVGALVAPFVANPATSVLLFDFDGTLAPIVDDPDDARPEPDLVGRLAELAAGYRCVGVISGRPIDFLVDHLPRSLHLSGLYGLESMVDGRVVVDPAGDSWRPVVAEAGRRAGQASAGLRVEPKGLSLTIHYRTRPELAALAADVAREIAVDTGLVVRRAKASIELHPPTSTDKGTVVRALAEEAGASAVMFVGDDVGDLPAFAVLARLRGSGLTTLAVAVRSGETAPEVVEAADLVVDGLVGVRTLFDALEPR